MEGEKILMAAGVTVAAVVGAFVFWGPTGSSRLRQRRGQIAGLHNFGQTCFINALLQAFAACPQFIAWLQLNCGSSTDRKSLVSSLLNTLEVINGTHPQLRSDPCTPGSVIRALNALGWVIPQEQEHDCHELLHVLLASLEEEVLRPKKIGCLSDALEEQQRMQNNSQSNRPSSAMLSDFANTEYNEITNVMRLVRSEAQTPDSGESPSSVEISQDRGDVADHMDMMSSPVLDRRSRMAQTQLAENLNKRISNSCRSLERLSRGPGRVSIWSDQMPSYIPHPFKGAMGTQIVCNGCGFKSAVRYDKFDSVTLNLPRERRTGLSLGHLLSEYVTSENLNDVKCESCNETTNHTKSLTFAKLPACLCFHISRTVWIQGYPDSPEYMGRNGSGQACKRQDYVHFPESLSMAPYCFVQPHLSSQAGTPWGSTMSLFSSSLPLGSLGAAGESPYGSSFCTMFPKNLYRLLAVVVHSGEANSGHFVTYRRGALRNGHRWYYTSDTTVREVSIDEVLSVPAYLLFYDRSTALGKTR